MYYSDDMTLNIRCQRGCSISVATPRVSKNVGVEFRSQGVESEEISELPSEEVEVLEQASEEILGEVLGWKERVVVLGIAGRDLE